MLKSLHQLQEENRRLEDQIKSLTMKKERLQLLSAQLSVPFTAAPSGRLRPPWLTVAHADHSEHLDLVCVADLKGAQLGGADSSLPAAAQVNTPT